MQASKLSVAKQRLKLARLSRDAERIERTAQIVLTITDNEIIEVRNPNAPLKIIAILGRGQTEGFALDKAVLCEVGFNRCRPYVCAQLPHKDRGNFNTVSAREKFFSLSEAQYQLVAPRLFAIMQELTNETVEQWKCGHNNPFLLSTNLNFVGSRGGLAEVLRKVETPRSTRYSVSTLDHFLHADLQKAELHLNKELRASLKRFSKYAGKSYVATRRYKNPDDSRVMKNLRLSMERAAKKDPYLLVEMLSLIPGGKRHSAWSYLAQTIADLTGWSGNGTAEHNLADSALPGASKRIGKIRLNFIRRKPNYVVVEVHASKQSTDGTDLVPF